MKNIFKLNKFSKIIILVLIFLGTIGITTTVKAVTQNMFLGTNQKISMKEIGIETEYGQIKEVSLSKSGIIKVEQTGTTSKINSKGMDLKVTALKEGTCTITVKYNKSFWAEESRKIFTITVKAKTKKITSISVKKDPAYKSTITVGDSISNNKYLIVTANYDDGTVKILSLSEYSISPLVATKTGDLPITVTLNSNKNLTTKFTVHVNPKTNTNTSTKTNTTTSTNTNTNTGTKTNTNNTTTTSVPKYSNGNKVAVGDCVKMTKGASWITYTSSSVNSVKNYIYRSNNYKFKVEAISGNAIKLSKDGQVIGWIKWYNTTNGAINYFAKVTNTTQTETSSAPKYSNGNKVAVGDTIKMTKGVSWIVYTSSSANSVKSYIYKSNNYKFKVEAISGNAIKLSKDGQVIGWIKWYNTTNGAINYFTK